MIICQYDTKKLDLNTMNFVNTYLSEKIGDKDLFITVPSGISIAEFANEDGLEVLEKLYDFLGKNIKMLKDALNSQETL